MLFHLLPGAPPPPNVNMFAVNDTRCIQTECIPVLLRAESVALSPPPEIHVPEADIVIPGPDQVFPGAEVPSPAPPHTFPEAEMQAPAPEILSSEQETEATERVAECFAQIPHCFPTHFDTMA
jgi:hypothetical protein